MTFFSPLEQFEIEPIFTFYTNSSHSIVIACGLSALFLSAGLFRSRLLPNRFQSIVELFYSFLTDIVRQQAGYRGMKYFPIVFTTFFFILFSNLIGLIPENFTSTSHIILTFTLSLSFNIGFLLIGFITYGFSYLWFFVPSGAPVFLLPLIVLIEVVSYLLRPFSLAIRLFANMMAGHTLLYILSSFVIGLSHSKFFLLAIVPFILVIAVVFLEIGIAFLQSYVFVVLMTIYLNDSLSISH